MIIKLILNFFKVGMLSFGGGYAVIAMLNEISVSNGWLAEIEFLQILAIAEMTPGTIALNTSTFIGYDSYGLLGALAATLSLIIGPFILINMSYDFILKHKEHDLVVKVINRLQVGVVALVVLALLKITMTSVLNEHIEASIDLIPIITFLVCLVLYKVKKMDPIKLIIGAATVGGLLSAIGL